MSSPTPIGHSTSQPNLFSFQENQTTVPNQTPVPRLPIDIRTFFTPSQTTVPRLPLDIRTFFTSGARNSERKRSLPSTEAAAAAVSGRKSLPDIISPVVNLRSYSVSTPRPNSVASTVIVAFNGMTTRSRSKSAIMDDMDCSSIDPRCTFATVSNPATPRVSPRTNPTTPRLSPRTNTSVSTPLSLSEVTTSAIAAASNGNREHDYLNIDGSNDIINNFLAEADGDFRRVVQSSVFKNTPLMPRFVTTIELDGLFEHLQPAECSENLRLLNEHFPNIDTLSLGANPSLSGICLDEIAKFQKLESLYASHSIKFLTEHPSKLSQLRIKCLIAQSPPTLDDAAAGASSVSRCTIDDAFAERISQMVELQGLDLRAAKISIYGIKSLTRLINLSAFSIANCPYLDSNAFNALQGFKSLTDLNVCGTTFNDHDLMNAATSLKYLNKLSINRDQISPGIIADFHSLRQSAGLPATKLQDAEGLEINVLAPEYKRIKSARSLLND